MASVLDIEVDSIDEARFWIWVTKTETCWIWEGTSNRLGYGRFGIKCGERMAHRISWVIANGPIPDKMHLDHICHVSSCVNPAHLRPVTPKQNAENLLPVRAKSGYRGVYRYGKKWIGSVQHDGVEHKTGRFINPEDAAEAVRELRNQLFTHNNLDRQPA